MKRGHSNLRAEQTEAWSNDLKIPNAPDVARIPLEGGAGVYTVRELPPLALRKSEWEEIGRRMNWLPEGKHRLSTDVNQTA
jgi:hypothetical protein